MARHVKDPHALSVRKALQELILQSGTFREEQRLSVQALPNGMDGCHTGPGPDLVLREEATGFELWIGCLEDALNLSFLHKAGINALLNCAVEDCNAECACFRTRRCCGRPRSHTRTESFEIEQNTRVSFGGLAKDQVWELACFDAEWYSTCLSSEVCYLSLAARDEAGFSLDRMFPEVIDFLGDCRSKGRKVLVHCLMGVNRAPAAVVAFLCQDFRMSLKAAIEQTARRRGYMLSNTDFLDQLIHAYSEPREEPHQDSKTDNEEGQKKSLHRSDTYASVETGLPCEEQVHQGEQSLS